MRFDTLIGLSTRWRRYVGTEWTVSRWRPYCGITFWFGTILLVPVVVLEQRREAGVNRFFQDWSPVAPNTTHSAPPL